MPDIGSSLGPWPPGDGAPRDGVAATGAHGPARTPGTHPPDPRPLPDRPLPFLWRYVARRRPAFLALLFLIVAAAACSLGVQYGMKLIVDTMASDDRSSRLLWQWLAVFVVLIGAESACWRLSGWLGCLTVVKTGVDVRLDLFRHLSGHSLDFFSRQLAGALGNRITATAGATGAIFGTMIWKVLPPCMDFLGAVIVLCTVDPRMALTLMAFVALAAALMHGFARRVKPLQQDFAERASLATGELVDVVSNMFTVTAHAAREREYRRLMQIFGVEARSQRRSWLFLEKGRAIYDLCLWFMAGAMLVWVIAAWSRGENAAGDVVLVSALTFRILHGSRELALSLVDASQDVGVIAEMLRVVAAPHELVDRPGAPALRAGPGAIEFHDISFAYDPQRPLFRNLHLSIPAGQRLGVVGPSGAGKSTLVRLVDRLMDPSAGRITIDGTDIAQVRQDSLREAIGMVPQDIALLHRTVMENLRYGNPEASDAQVREAARAALCEDFIEALPQGYDTVVGERGTRLSGGQRQRIGIARAMLRNAPILLLDEATSALDSRSEVRVQAALDRLMHGRTVVAVAHRLSTVASFDRVIVLVDGQIVQDGPPQQLLQQEGLFAELWRLQAQGQETP